MAAINYRVNNVLERREMIELVQELKPQLYPTSSSMQVSCHITPKEKKAGYIKGFVTPKYKTTDRSSIKLEQQFWWHNLVEDH